MANLKKYTTNVIGSAETLNTCPRIVVYLETTETKAITLFTMSEIAADILSGNLHGLVLPRVTISKDPLQEGYEYRKDNLTWIHSDLPDPDSDEYKEDTYRKRQDWGFDVIIYLSSSGDALGYTKFSEPNGKGKSNLNIILNFSVSVNDSLGSEIELETSISSIGKTHENKIQGYPRVKNLGSAQSPGQSRYSSHLGGRSIDFLGVTSILESGEAVKVDLLHSEVINPYARWTEFISHQVSYYGGDDIVLDSWTSSHYNIVSLLRTDYFGHPFVYTVTKEGRRPIQKYNGQDTTILYLSGKYAICDVLGTTKIYDTSRDIWLETSGWVISNPLRPDNKIVDLISSQIPYNQLAAAVPEVNNLFLDLSSGIVNIYRVIGNWVILENETTSSLRSYKICGPMIALDILKSELPFITFLNDSVLLYYDDSMSRCVVYSGYGKEFVSPRYKLNYEKLGLSEEPKNTGEEIPKDNIYGTTLDLFRRRAPHRELPRIISGFSGLVYYADDKNRLYYL